MVASLLLLLAAGISVVNAGYYEQNFECVKRELAKAKRTNDSRLSWKVGRNAYFAGKRLSYLTALMGSNLAMTELRRKISPRNLDTATMVAVDLPADFDSRKQWPMCEKLISYIRDQSNCGSCWAISAASILSDRSCIITNGSFQYVLSEQELLSCCRDCGYGCNGGFVDMALKYSMKRGLPTGGPYGDTTSCKPYSIKPCRGAACPKTKTPKCTASCIPSSQLNLSKDRYFGSSLYSLGTENAIMMDIYLYGPVAASFIVYSDFLYYKSGVYEHKAGFNMGGHAVRLIGWGVENDKKYWLAANSWNTTWGEKGLFKIRRGNNECDVEKYVVAGQAKA